MQDKRNKPNTPSPHTHTHTPYYNITPPKWIASVQFFDIIGQNPHVSKSERLHIVIIWVFLYWIGLYSIYYSRETIGSWSLERPPLVSRLSSGSSVTSGPFIAKMNSSSKVAANVVGGHVDPVTCHNEIRAGTSRWESTSEVGSRRRPNISLSRLLAHCFSFFSSFSPGQSS